MITLLAFVLLAAAPDAPGGPRPCVALGRDETVAVDFAEVPLWDVARFVSCALERNLMFQAPALAEKRVTVIAPQPVGRRELARLWYALLFDNNLVEETHGGFALVRPVRR